MTDFLARAATASPDAAALLDRGTAVSYRELDRRVDQLARRVAGLGLTAGDTVAARVGPGVQGISLVHAVRRAGCVLAPLHPRWTDAEVRVILDSLEPACLIAEGGRGPTVLSGPHAGLLADVAPAAAPPSSGLPEVYAVLWTSGTSGRHRAVEITAGSLEHSARASADRLGLAPSDRWYASLQLAHVGGLALVVRGVVLGSAVWPTGGFDVSALSEALDRGDATHASLVPVMLRSLLDHRGQRPAPATVGTLLIGGAAAPRAWVVEALDAGWPVALTYGMTETTSQVTTAPPELVRRNPGAVGRPLDGVELLISDSGEILVRGPTLARGYRDEPGPMTDSEGWFHTGDLGTVDADGVLRVTGRRSERIVTGGVTVDPEEVARALRSAPHVADVAVIGLPDDRWGEIVVAAVVPHQGRPLRPADLKRHQEERLSAMKHVRRFRVVDALPLNPNGKVDRAALARLFLAGTP